MRKAIFAAALLGAAGTTSAQLINEFEPNPGGADPATTVIELLGAPGASFNGWLVALESDAGSSAGNVNNTGLAFENVSGSFDANGLLTVTVPDLENPSFTLILTDSFTGNATTDIDTNDDGIVDDVSAFGTIYDAVGITDNGTDPVYGAQLGGADLGFIGFEPSLAFRDGVTGDWYSAGFTDVFDASGNQLNNGDFSADPTASTFGGVNPTLIPAPASAALLGLGGLVAARRRR